ncbi:MAG: biotin--[acetyl-CoA-carboxylase] ligase [Tannerella sp.]|jgi:BirA family biotin operon repressor/biotin-[acetyl-CoA-carboxylase] ligase|nr:biotin--[acetyl-CoA-carboxylase] ligase [Tannerella sp.]
MSTPKFIHLPETESTNQSLRILTDAGALPNFSVLWADYQTKGRGQAGSSWESAPGENLLCSIVFYPARLPANRSFSVLETAALSVKSTLETYATDITIKWPNDIYCRDKKICGILIENEIVAGCITRSIIGIGININQTAFKGDAPNPVSLAMITGKEYDRQEILNQLLKNFQLHANKIDTGDIEDLHLQYCASLYRRDGFHVYKDAQGFFTARFFAVEPFGHLILERKDGTLSRYAFKEVEAIITN